MLPYPLEDILQDAVEQVIVLLCNLKTGRTMEGMMVIAVIRDAVLRSEVLPMAPIRSSHSFINISVNDVVLYFLLCLNNQSLTAAIL